MAVKRIEGKIDSLPRMTAKKRDTYLNLGLKQTVKNAYRHATAARKLLDGVGVRPSDIVTVKDLEKLPITRKTDLIEMQKAEPPFGGLLCIPAEKLERIFISPGPVYEYQPARINWFARTYWVAGFRRGDIVVNTFTYHMSPAGMLFHEGLRKCGATVVVMGTGNTDILIKTMLDLKVTGFLGTPSFLMTVIKRAEELGYRFNEQFALQKTWFTGEMLSKSVRRTLEEVYHLATYQAYAVTEPGGAIAYECREKAGLHLMDDYVVEIVDPQTGKQLPPGEVGEIVVTPIHNRTWGLLRFGTGDLSSLITGQCACGRTSARLSGILGRTGDAVKVRGMFIVAKQVEALIAEIPQITKYRLVIGRPENRDEMLLEAELKSLTKDEARLAEEINRKFQESCRLKLDKVAFVDQGKIAETRQTIVDERKWD